MCWLVVLTGISSVLYGQTGIMGRVVTHTGEAVAGVHIYCPESREGVLSDSTGYFRISCPIPCTLELSHVGYHREEVRISSDEAPFVVILRNRQNNLREVIVSGMPTSGSIYSTFSQIERIPAILGEQDILKYLATLPGVVTTNPFNAGIYVRGGNSHENGFLVNDMPIANPDHLTGILSTFDPFVLSGSTLYKSGFPSRYNGSLASFLNMRPDALHRREHEGEVSLGLISSAVKSRGPLLHNTSYAISSRISYLQQIARIYNREVGDDTGSSPMPEYRFGDITAALQSRPSEKWRLNAFGIGTIDRLKMKLSEQVQYHFNWHTLSGNLGVYHTPSASGMLSLQVGAKSAFSEGSSSGSIPMGGGNRYYTLMGKTAYFHQLSQRLRLNGGLRYEYNRFETANREDGFGNLLFKSSELTFSLYEGYLEADFHLNRVFSLSGGVNYQLYEGDCRRQVLSPRLKITYSRPGFTLWADYAKTAQFLSLYPYFTVKTPVDIWYPLGRENRPAICHQFSIGCSWEAGRLISLYAGVFQKRMRHVKDFTYDPQSEYTVLSDRQIEGTGRAGGVETDGSLAYRNFYLRVNYTLSQSKRRFAEINNGKSFFPPYDVKHNVVVNSSWNFTPRWTLNLLWNYASGVHTTFPEGIVIAHNISDLQVSPVIIPVYGERYNYRLPDNHRLDANLDYQFHIRSTACKLSVGAYNLYNQSNPSFVYFKPEEDENQITRFNPKSQVILPFIPYLLFRMYW